MIECFLSGTYLSGMYRLYGMVDRQSFEDGAAVRDNLPVAGPHERMCSAVSDSNSMLDHHITHVSPMLLELCLLGHADADFSSNMLSGR